MKTLCKLGAMGIGLVTVASADIYGIKSLAPSSGQPSAAPATLFRFSEDGSGLTSIGAITMATAGQIDADGLALSAHHGLMAFWVTANGSSLLSLDSTTAVGNTVGSFLSARDIRGAAFDLHDRLWAVDAASNELLRIDPLTGDVTGGALAIHTSTGALDVSNGTDLAVHASGAMWLVSGNEFYALDVNTGLATLLGADPTVGPVNFLPGAAFSTSAPQDRLFGYEANGTDDVVYYDADQSFSPHYMYTNIIGSYNSGRGDLASLMIPAPGSIVLCTLAVCVLPRRRR